MFLVIKEKIPVSGSSFLKKDEIQTFPDWQLLM